MVMISKAFVRDTYQRKLEEIGRQDGVDLTLISPPAWRDGGTTLPLTRRFTSGYELVVTPIAFNGRFHLHFYPRLPGLLRALRPDLVHVDEEPYNLATWLGLRAARGVGARCLFFTWQNLRRRLPVPFSTLESWSYGLARGAIAGNQDAAGVLRAKGFRRPIWVIPQLGIDPELFRPIERAAGGEFRIGYVGRLVRAKGVDLLLRACQGLADPWTLALVGDGEERAALQEQSRSLGLGERVRFLGEIGSTDMPLAMAGFDALVLPSRSAPSWREQFGRVLPEAMACAIPVVGSGSGEIPRVIGDAGLVFPEEDWSTLRAHLLALQQDPERRRALGRSGRERALRLFTHRSVAERTVAAYREVLCQA
ncbi:MAG: glycosyltransferase family 4 protein [Chloroflexota bacterium]